MRALRLLMIFCRRCRPQARGAAGCPRCGAHPKRGDRARQCRLPAARTEKAVELRRSSSCSKWIRRASDLSMRTIIQHITRFADTVASSSRRTGARGECRTYILYASHIAAMARRPIWARDAVGHRSAVDRRNRAGEGQSEKEASAPPAGNRRLRR